MKVFNPLFDTIFKYLMEDIEIARGLIALIIDQEVLELTPLPQEQTGIELTIKYNQLSLKRYDYVAAIRSTAADGTERIEKILIEVQRSHIAPEIPRFRSYLAEKYRQLSSINLQNSFEQRYLPIKTIYLLEKTFNAALPAVLLRKGVCRDVLNNTEYHGQRDELVELFNHDSWFIQVELLPPNLQSELHYVLSIFAPQYRIKSEPRYINLPDDQQLTQKHELLQRIVNRLKAASGNSEIRTNMELEQQYNDFIDNNLATIDRERKEKLAALQQITAERKQREVAEEQAKVAAEQAKADRDKREAAEQIIINTIKQLHSMNIAKEQIAAITGKTVDEIEKLLADK